MLINLSNHPNNNWEPIQKKIAIQNYGKIIDMSFPAIDPIASEQKIQNLALEYSVKITEVIKQSSNSPNQNAVHIQGEFTFVFNLVTMLKQSGIKCIASTSERNVEINQKGEKIVKFIFVQFRNY
jgi:hypothetical protein